MGKVLFVILSTTIKFQGYDLKNAPVSTGRADLLARFIMSSLFKPGTENDSIAFNDSYGVWIFLNHEFIEELSNHFQIQGSLSEKLMPFSVLITSRSPFFDSAIEKNKKFFSEFDILRAIFDSFENIQIPNYENSIFTKLCDNSLAKSIEKMRLKGYKVFILDEEAPNYISFQDPQDFFKDDENLLFLIGDQLGNMKFDFTDLAKIPPYVTRITFGKESHLSSSVVTLIKFILNKSQIK